MIPDEPRPCAIDRCDRSHYARGWCVTHYRRWKRWGTTDDPAPFEAVECSVDGCEKASRRNGLCETHSQRQAVHGDPLTVLQIQGNDRARFDQYVDRNGPMPLTRPDLGRCWQWTGVKHRDFGYGRFYVGGRGGRYWQAHRWSYTEHVGPIPDGLEVDHLCFNTSCVRPEHLEAVTRVENQRRAAAFRATR